MEGLLKIIIGLVVLGVALGYLYRPAWILRFNAWGRLFFFNDAYVLFYRRRWGLPLFFISLLFFYSGFKNLSQHRDQRAVAAVSSLDAAVEALRSGDDETAIRLGRDAVREDPSSRTAQSLLRAALERRRRRMRTHGR